MYGVLIERWLGGSVLDIGGRFVLRVSVWKAEG